jgi:hypothetical protein
MMKEVKFDEFVSIAERFICPLHKANPELKTPQCGCSTMYFLKKKSEVELQKEEK